MSDSQPWLLLASSEWPLTAAPAATSEEVDWLLPGTRNSDLEISGWQPGCWPRQGLCWVKPDGGAGGWPLQVTPEIARLLGSACDCFPPSMISPILLWSFPSPWGLSPPCDCHPPPMMALRCWGPTWQVTKRVQQSVSLEWWGRVVQWRAAHPGRLSCCLLAGHNPAVLWNWAPEDVWWCNAHAL